MYVYACLLYFFVRITKVPKKTGFWAGIIWGWRGISTALSIILKTFTVFLKNRVEIGLVVFMSIDLKYTNIQLYITQTTDI